MRIRQKPNKPKREQLVHYSVEISDDISLQTLLDKVNAKRDESITRYSDINITQEYEYDDYTTMWLEWKCNEPDKEFDRCMEEYKTKLAKYEKWFSENFVEITAELEKREANKEAKHQRLIDSLEKQLEKIKSGHA